MLTLLQPALAGAAGGLHVGNAVAIFGTQRPARLPRWRGDHRQSPASLPHRMPLS